MVTPCASDRHDSCDSSTLSVYESLHNVRNDLYRTLTLVHIAIDGVVVAIEGLGDRIRDDALDSLQQLRGRGWRTVMLSGVVQDVVASVGRSLAFEAEDSIGAVSPEANWRLLNS